jgi:hypothetical protein
MGRRALIHIWECHISALDRVQNKAAKFEHHSGDSDCESLAQRKKIARICLLYKAYTVDRAWKAIGNRLQETRCLCRADNYWKIIARKQRTNIRKYSFVKRFITNWNRLPEGAVEASNGNKHIFKTKFREVIISKGK